MRESAMTALLILVVTVNILLVEGVNCHDRSGLATKRAGTFPSLK
jgi:hypothetical protein